ncbi:hypothetical protein IEE91_05195 [Kocuria sp. cx-455]|uniref:hypothetical protein n=1 Tax=Kocuria sp. cx-455 TaxID=2771377 RepID=UPI0016890C85|nr:hypothetical protein [Kocuria sp. cx-455]MBD2764599.1 hypothetical protein [Kocuria sp. cx-455]
MAPTPATSTSHAADQRFCASGTRPDEVHVLFAGLDPIAATTALLMADAGVCLINVTDPTPVTAHDAAAGPYPPALTGSPREYALRKLLRARWPRCVPLSAPELFCSSVIPTAVMLRSTRVAGPLPQDLSVPVLATPPDAHLPTITTVTDGSVSLTWPLLPWYRRPCRECLEAAVRDARRLLRNQPLRDHGAVATPHSPAITTLTRVITASQLTVGLLGQALDSEACPRADGAVEAPVGLTIRHGLHRAELTPRGDCLCTLDG